MQEAVVLGTRLCLLQRGKVKRVGTPQFFKSLYSLAPKVVFSFNRFNEQNREDKQTRQLILDAVKPEYKESVKFIDTPLD